MFAMSFSHEYGIDITLYATLELAERAACCIIADWFDDFVHLEESSQLANLINAGEYSKALALWDAMDHMESITIQSVTLKTEVINPVHIQIDTD